MKTVKWRLHCVSSPQAVFELLTIDAGRERFWSERSRASGDGFLLTFPDGTEELCTVREIIAPSRFAFSYFGTEVTIDLADDGASGTDLTLTNSGIAEADYEEVHAGWLSVLLPLKATVDFAVDLRNHDPSRTWRQGYVDQ